MPIRIKPAVTARKLRPRLERLFELSAGKILSLEKSWKPEHGSPVITVKGRYTSRAWTEWTQGFQFGSALLQFDATGEERFLELGRRKTVQFMAPHLSHFGVHDHGFNNVSTYGNLLRLMREGKTPFNEWEREFYHAALKVSGAVQAARWTPLADGRGYIYSFNGPHSLFIDTLRSLRSLAIAHQLGHVLMGERDCRVSLLRRLVEHAETTAAYSVYYGAGRDAYDARGRTAHESIFNPNDGHYRCPNSQQGYSPFSTWTRGLAWAVLGFAEELEFLEVVCDAELEQVCRPDGQAGSGWRRGTANRLSVNRSFVVQPLGSRGAADRLKPAPRTPRLEGASLRAMLLKAATATADFYLEQACADGIPMWDTGAPNLWRLGDYLSELADPYNPWEPVDSSAAAIAAQGLLRLGNYLLSKGNGRLGRRYRQAGLTIADTLLSEPYLAADPRHQGLLLHSVYHRPNGWDYVAPGQKVPNGESSAWGDYHLRELALMLLRETRGECYLAFFDHTGKHSRPENVPDA